MNRHVKKWGRVPYLGPDAEKRLAREAANRKPKRKFIRHATPQTMSRRAKYNRRVKVWLTEPGNDLCMAYLKSPRFRLEMQNNFGIMTTPKSTQNHHIRGRRLTKQGDLLLYEKWWCPVSDAGQVWVHSHPTEAIELGLLAPKGEFNTWKP